MRERGLLMGKFERIVHEEGVVYIIGNIYIGVCE